MTREHPRGGIPLVLLEQLASIEPSVEFSGSPPKVRSTSGNIYFVKYGTSIEREQYAGEVVSLREIEAAAPGLAPRVLSFGIDNDDRPYFVSEYKELGRLGISGGETLATRLATELHAHTSNNGFGFHIPTYCGATRLKDGWFESWEACFSSMVGDLLDQLREKGNHEELCSLGDRVIQSVIPKLLGPLQIQPVLLHGDLWSGNVGVDPSGQPIIFDPSSFYGHNEADLAISRMFGGFPSAFYNTYDDLFPKTKPVEQYPYRCEIYELFHYLNHTLLFGASYEHSAKQKIVKLLDWAGKD